MSGRWRFWVEERPWSGVPRKLFAVRSTGGARSAREHVHSIVAAPIGESEAIDVPLLEETREEQQDGVGDVTQFLQAAMDAGWEMGLRPAAAKDHTNEQAAVRYHLEDMRALALKKP